MALPVLLRRLFFISLILCVVVPVSWLLLWNNSVDNKLDINTYAKHHLPQAATTSSTTAKSSVVERSVKKYRPTRPGVLVLYKYKSSINFHLIKTLLQSLRIDFDSFVMSKAALIPKLVHSSSSANAVGIYRFIIIVNAGEFYQDSSISTLFNEYCQQFDAVMILMASLDAKEMHFNRSKLHDYYDKDVSVFSLPSSLCSYDLKLNGANDFVYTADGGYWNVSNVANKTKAFWLYENKFEGTMFGSIPVKPDEMTKRFRVFASVLYCDKTHQRHSLPVVMIDQKAYGNIKKVYFGLPMSVALAKLLFMEILNAFSENSYRLLNLTTRWIQIDIDDIFVAPPGSKLKESDVEAMINAQKQFQSIMNGFQFNLGFCGSYYQKGLMSEKIADKLLVSNAQLFKWFGHTYEHSKPHTMSLSSLYLSFKQNKLFAKKHNLPINPHYAVSPHHSGVYPIHESLYTAWADIWNITVTSTEEYPHLRPDHMRRGFIHNDIMVLPRQTCRLFTHTTNYSHFHGGREEVISFSEGGEVFNTVLYNPVCVQYRSFKNWILL
jgi:heparan sulfate N-deacetylase/N-sulfotransferase NDST2